MYLCSKISYLQLIELFLVGFLKQKMFLYYNIEQKGKNTSCETYCCPVALSVIAFCVLPSSALPVTVTLTFIRVFLTHKEMVTKTTLAVSE